MSLFAEETVRLGRASDLVGSFIAFGLETGRIDAEGLELDLQRAPLESWDERALEGAVPADVTMLSPAAWAHVCADWRLLRCGAEIMPQSGPCLVTRTPTIPDALAGISLASAGSCLSGTLAARLRLGPGELECLPADRIAQGVADGSLEAGVLTREQWIAHAPESLYRSVDLAQWWHETTEEGLPIRVCAIRRDLGDELAGRIERVLSRSALYAFDHQEAAINRILEPSPVLGGMPLAVSLGMSLGEWLWDASTAYQSLKVFIEHLEEEGLIPEGALPCLSLDLGPH